MRFFRPASASPRRRLTGVWVLFCAFCLIALTAQTATVPDPLPSWQEGPVKRAIIEFVKAVTDKASPTYVAPADRVATFDDDGTLWVEHPLYTEFVFALDRLRVMAPQHPEWKKEPLFRKVLAGGVKAMVKLKPRELGRIYAVTHSGMTMKAFLDMARQWLGTAKHPRFHRLYTELAYLPMVEVLKYLRAHGFTTYIVTGGGQEFVRAFAEQVYGVPPEQVVGTSLASKYEYRDGKPVLWRLPKMFFVCVNDGKAIGINLFIGKRPQIAFGNSMGDREMLEWTTAGEGKRLGLLVLHDDPRREYAYGPAEGLPDTTVGRFPPALLDEAKKQGWEVISMKGDWKKVFAWE